MSASQTSNPVATPSHFIRVEAEALLRLAARLEDEMRPALDYAIALISNTVFTHHRVAVTGIGKSGPADRRQDVKNGRMPRLDTA